MVKEYSQLSDTTKSRYSSMLEKLHKSGYSITEVRDFSGMELKKALGNKATVKTNEAYIRIIKQISKTPERKERTIALTLISYKNFGYRGKKLDVIEKELIKTSGNTFMSIAKDLQNVGYSEKESYYKTRELLKVPKSDYDKKLTITEKNIIENYDVIS